MPALENMLDWQYPCHILGQAARPNLNISRKPEKMARGSDTVLTPQAVKRMIADGHAIVIFDGLVLRLDSWLGRHPGGRLAILHMIGKDATDEMTV